jgi:hypothetical protein
LNVLHRDHTPRVACIKYNISIDICNNNDFVNTFFEECPIYENPITLVSGSVLRIRLNNFLMEVTDRYRTVYFSIRRMGGTAVVPSVVLRTQGNRVTFIRG